MGIKKMVSQGVSGSRGISSTVAVSIGGSGSSTGIQTLAQQSSSMYSLTLNEVESQLGDLGKPFCTMSLDELLKNVCNVEINQAVIGLMGYAAAAGAGTGAGAGAPSLARVLSKKTVDEVWKDIQGEQRNISLDRQLTLGELTLEEFLVKAGILADSSSGKGHSVPHPSRGIETMQNIQQHQQWMSYQISPISQQKNMVPVFMQGQSSRQVAPLPPFPNPMMDASYPEGQMGTFSDTQTPGRNRGASGAEVVERTDDRKQKRMIKNRESAARSRARKQAYTHELEIKVSQLEEENDSLKRQKEIDNILPCEPFPVPRYQLRRTSSASF